MAVTPQQLANLKADRDLLAAALKRHREQVASGELLLLAEWEARQFTEARRIRDIILAAPARYAAEFAAELQVDEWSMLQVLNKAARTLLTLASGNGPFPAAEPVAPPKSRRKRPRRSAGVVPPASGEINH